MAKKEKPKNIRERDGKFHFRYSIKEEVDGKTRRKQKETPAFDTRKEAEDEGIRIKAAILNGTYIDESNITISQWVEKWIKEYYAVSGRVKEPTVKVRRDGLAIAERYFSTKNIHKLKDITEDDYQIFLNALKTMETKGGKKGYSQKTIRMIHEAMRMLFKRAVRIKLIDSDPTKDAEIPGFQQTVEELENEEELPEYMEKEQLALFLKKAREYGDPQIFNALFLLAYTGLRIGELCALKDTDFDEVNRKISITKTLQVRRTFTEYYLGTPKTKSSKRKVDLGKGAMDVIKQQLAWLKEYKFSIGSRYYNDVNFLFVNNKFYPGYPMSPRELLRHMKAILERSGLSSSLSLHSLRHTYTSLMAEAGVELPAIQRLLGHRNDNITRRVYLHVTEPKKREAVDKLDDLMSGLL